MRWLLEELGFLEPRPKEPEPVLTVTQIARQGIRSIGEEASALADTTLYEIEQISDAIVFEKLRHDEQIATMEARVYELQAQLHECRRVQAWCGVTEKPEPMVALPGGDMMLTQEEYDGIREHFGKSVEDEIAAELDAPPPATPVIQRAGRARRKK